MNQIKFLTDFNEAISQDSPNCLYCNAHCKYNETEVDTSNFQSVEIYFCEACSERFIHYRFTIDNTSLYFSFSCKSIVVTVYTDHIFIGNNIKCPLVSFDFSDKDKLFNKLKTYVVFS